MEATTSRMEFALISYAGVLFTRAKAAYEYRRNAGIFMIGRNIAGSPVEEKGYKRMIKQPDYPDNQKEKSVFAKQVHRPVFFPCIFAPFCVMPKNR